jgi:hypothetical protein
MVEMAMRTGLRRMAWINLDHPHPAFLCFVGQEAVELGEAPTVEASFGVLLLALAPPDLARAANVGQVLKDDRAARGGVLNNAFGENVVMVFALAQQFSRELTQVAFRALCAFCLKFSTETEETPFLLVPSTLTQEVTSGGDGGTVESQVSSYDFLRGHVL